jgi:hypothetical protein
MTNLLVITLVVNDATGKRQAGVEVTTSLAYETTWSNKSIMIRSDHPRNSHITENTESHHQLVSGPQRYTIRSETSSDRVSIVRTCRVPYPNPDPNVVDVFARTDLSRGTGDEPGGLFVRCAVLLHIIARTV